MFSKCNLNLVEIVFLKVDSVHTLGKIQPQFFPCILQLFEGKKDSISKDGTKFLRRSLPLGLGFLPFIALKLLAKPLGSKVQASLLEHLADLRVAVGDQDTKVPRLWLLSCGLV